MNQIFYTLIGNIKIGNYDNSTFLSENEVLMYSCDYFVRKLKEEGYSILSYDPIFECRENIIAKTPQGEIIMILVRAKIAPDMPSFVQSELDDLMEDSQNRAVPYIASISIGSCDPHHFNDGVLCYEDRSRFRINSFFRLELEDEEYN